MLSEVEAAPELRERITANATKRKALLSAIIPVDVNSQSYDTFKESFTENSSASYQSLMENLASTKADSTLQNALTKLRENHHSDAIVGRMSIPNNTRQRQDCASFISQANSLLLAGHA